MKRNLIRKIIVLLLSVVMIANLGTGYIVHAQEIDADESQQIEQLEQIENGTKDNNQIIKKSEQDIDTNKAMSSSARVKEVEEKESKTEVDHTEDSNSEILLLSSSNDLVWGDYTYTVTRNEATITGYSGTSTTVSIPNSIDGYTVIGIGYRAFSGLSTLSSITLPESIVEIHDYAFSGCTSLSSLTLPKNVTYLGSYIIQNTKISSLMIPKSVLSTKDTIYLDECCPFANCRSLNEVIFEDGITKIPDSLCAKSSIKKVIIPDSVTEIGSYAFSNCRQLESILMKHNNTAENTMSIGSYAFEECIKLTDVYLSENVSSIGNYAFSDCTSLSSLTLPEGVQLGYCIIKNTAISSLTIPQNALYIGRDIGKSPWTDCKSLTEIIFEEGITEIPSCMCTNSYVKKVVIPDSITKICHYAFRDCTGLSSLTLPPNVVCIDYGVFQGCTGLSNLVLPEKLTSLGENFIRGTGIKSITIPKNLAYCGNFLDDGPLAGSNVAEVIFEEGMKKIPDYVCSISSGDSSYITKVVIPESVTEIGSNTFYKCNNMTIYGYANSYAEMYANNNKIPFIDIKEISSVTKIPGAINHYYGVNSYKNTPTGEIYDDSIAFIKAMDNYLVELRKATQKDAQLINKTTKSAAQLLKEADAATNDKMITMDATMPDAALNSVYETLAQYLDMYVDTGVSLGKIDMSASTIEISTSIVNKIRNNLDSLDFTRKIGSYTVTFKILKFMGAYTGSVNVRGNGRTYTGIIVSNSRETAKVLTTYINDMSQWAKDALYQALKSIFTELADITGIADYTKKEINSLLKDKVQLLQDKGYGNLLAYWLAMRDGYDICQKIAASKDAASLSDALKNAESIYNKIKKLDYSDEAVLNKTVVTAMNKLNNAKDNLEQSLYDYISGTDNGNQGNWWNNMWSSFKSIFIQCPVDFVIYDDKGSVLGKVEDSEITCTSDIHIEMDGDVKTVIIPSDINAKIEFAGTDTGDMTCVIEQTVDGKITGRANYYNIPLSDGSMYLQDIPGDYLTNSNSPKLQSDSASYAVSEYISVDNKDANITVECDADEGGTAIGMGDYAKGSPVVLTAYPDNESVKFIGWFVGDNLVEADSVYRFAALNDVSVRAMFKTSWEKDDSYSSSVSEKYEESTDISVYKSTDGLNDVVISMAGLEDMETLNVSLKGYDKSNNLIKNTKVETQYDGVYRFVLFDLNLKKYSKTEVYDEESQLIGTIKFVGKGEENLPDSNTANVSQPAKVARISISGISKKIATGKKIKLTANITPSNAANKAVTWKSSNKKVATVNSKGVVAMKKKSGGKSVTITATAKDGSGVKATYKIKSMKGAVKKVTISGKKSVKAGKTLKLKAKVTATKKANKKLKWTSSNTKYATVSSSGKVKARKAGKGKKVKITAMATDGSGKKKSVTIKVN